MRFPLIYLSPRCRLFLLVFPAVCGVLPSVPLAGQAVYLDASAPVEDRVADLLSRMTLDEKIGQMTQANIGAVNPRTDIRDYHLGSLLSGGGEPPARNTPQAWADAIDGFQAIALSTRLQIPLLYGVDAVHGHNNLHGATIFPHNIGMGATGNPELVRQAAAATAVEVAATGPHWTFAPAVSVARDERWGRTYESFSEDTRLVTRLGLAAMRGYQGEDLTAGTSILACVKHYAGDGGTLNGIDQGDTILDEATFREIHLTPYVEAVKAGARTIMVSFSSWNGTKLHGHAYLLTDVLRGELGFDGLLLSDWAGVDQVDPNYTTAVATAINAGIDMVMVPSNYPRFITTLRDAVNAGTVPVSRIDEAVRRILRIKFESGLFENPYAERSLLGEVGGGAHRAIARQAVAESLVILQDVPGLIPLAKDLARIHVAGKNADNLGHQCGGWTINWQGGSGDITIGTTILEGIRAAVDPATQVSFSLDGAGAAGADVGIVVVGETPYAEFQGDRGDLSLPPGDIAAIEAVRSAGVPVIVVLVSGRPLFIESRLPDWDACIAAWLPGTEGRGVADVLFGDVFPTGTLSHSWPRDFAVPSNKGDWNYNPLFPLGYSIHVEADSDSDGLPDVWEARNGLDPHDNGSVNPDFGSSGDPDKDGRDNRYEFETGTHPQRSDSLFRITSVNLESPGASPVIGITVTTVPGYAYAIRFSDQGPGSTAVWNAFANQANGIGSWTESGFAETTFTFMDDFSASTSGYQPSSGRRFYRVMCAQADN